MHLAAAPGVKRDRSVAITLNQAVHRFTAEDIEKAADDVGVEQDLDVIPFSGMEPGFRARDRKGYIRAAPPACPSTSAACTAATHGVWIERRSYAHLAARPVETLAFY